MDFYNQFEHTIDGKGRLVLPSAYRAAFVDGGFLTLLGDNAALFTNDGWEKYRRRLQLEGGLTRDELRVIFGSASPFVPDSQHRIIVGPRVRERVGLDRSATIVGSGTHAAIYPPEVWARIEAQTDRPDADGLTLNDKIKNLGFL